MTAIAKLRLSSERDLPLLKFIWRWKVVPLDILKDRFFPKSRTGTCFNRLNQLRRAGYLDTVYVSQMRLFVWTLRKKGFGALREWLPHACHVGYKSETAYHDVLSLFLNLGDWVSRPDKDGKLFSEQELRRLSSEFYEDWVPVGFDHRSDGYIKIGQEDSSAFLAIEVELSPKTVSEYRHLAVTYAHCPNLKMVIWAVPTARMAKGLQKIFSEYGPSSQKLHQFVLKDSLQKSKWAAVVIEGSKLGQSIRELVAAVEVNKASYAAL